MTNPEREMVKAAKNPEATKVSDEEYQEADCTSAVGSRPQGMQSTPKFRKGIADGCFDSNLDDLNWLCKDTV
jgi:hypothetical protein